jgi:hypothetical protein
LIRYANSREVAGYELSLLPVDNKKEEEMGYSEERLKSDIMKNNRRVILLIDSIAKEHGVTKVTSVPDTQTTVHDWFLVQTRSRTIGSS